MRKIAVILTLMLFAGALSVLAQDATPTPAPQTSAAQGQGVPGVVGLDVFDRAGQAFDGQNFKQAATDYGLFILLNPTSSQAYYDRALSYIQMNDTTNSLADLSRALALPVASPQLTARIYYLRAAIYIQLNEPDLAMSDLNAGVTADPTLPGLYFQRGQLFASQNDLENALTDLSKYVELSPNDPDGYNLLARVNAQLKNYDDALAAFNQLIILTPNDPAPYASRAQIYMQQEKYAPALADLTSAIKLEPRAGQLYLLRGGANNQLGNQADAAKDYFEWERSQQTNINTDFALRPGESQIVQMKTGQIYILQFEGKTGQKVTISASARPGETTDPLLILLDPQAAPLVADDDGGGNFDSAITDYTLPADGIYGVTVGYAGGGMNGPVRVLLQVAP